MAALIPFRALRPVPAAAERVGAVPYDVVNAEEARALAAENPLSFLHVSRAEIDLPAEKNPYADAIYAKAVENFTQLKTSAPLIVEESPALYVYRLQMGSHIQNGVAGTFSLDEYDRDIIKKHERTRRDKEDDRTRHINALRAQTGPVFLTYRASDAVDTVVGRVTSGTPIFNFTAVDGIRHSIWRTERRDERDLIEAFDRIAALYIADGHHRAASAARVREQLRPASGAPGAWDTFLAVAFPDSQVQVLPYNRIVKDLGRFTPDTLRAAISEHYTVKPGPAQPQRRGDVAMFLDNRWQTISLGDPAPQLSAADRLDVSRLQDAILTPLLGIGDIRSDKRIDFVGGARGTSELAGLVTSGAAAVAFSLFPVGVGDLMEIADAGGIMPPKSTWFEPKLRDGLLSHVI
jgi:uncharacterized protein (DUF1015 family)